MARKKKETAAPTTAPAKPVVAPEPTPTPDAAPPSEPMIFTLGTCRACLRWIAAEEDAGPFADQHAAGCTLRDDPSPFPRDDAEMADVRERCARGPIPPPAKPPPERPATTTPPVEPKPEKAPRKPRARRPKASETTPAPQAGAPAPAPVAPPVEPASEALAAPVTTSVLDTIRKAYPELDAPEIIDGCDVAQTAATMVNLSIAYSPVLPARESFLPVEATPLDGGQYRVYVKRGQYHSIVAVEAIDVSEADLKVMRARYLLRRGELLKIYPAMDPEVQRGIRDRFFGGTMPWMPPAGSPLADMTEPITMKRTDGAPIDWKALLTTLTTPGAKPPEVAPVVKPTLPAAALGAERPRFKPPKAHRIEGPHDKRCGRWKVHDLKRLDPKKLPEELKLCDECWGAWEAEQAKPDFGRYAHGGNYNLGTGRSA
jgi:hypothetical protein